jgi:hypothetical protein
MIRKLIHLITGYERDPKCVRIAEELQAQRKAKQEAYEASIAHNPPTSAWGRDSPHHTTLYDGHPVPDGVSLDKNAKFLDGWNEAWAVAPADNGVDVVIFNHDYRAETERGEVIYGDDFRRDEEDREPGPWLARIVAIHERLEQGAVEAPCERVVRFRGSTPSTYRLERPPSVIFQFIAPQEKHDTVLALHQRWALQYLAACRHIHAKSIVLNAPSVAESIWLRSDFSLVIAGFVAASCASLNIRAGYWMNGATLESPFGPADSSSLEPPFGIAECGEARADLFNWACWIYELMTGCESPVVDCETLWMWDGPEGDRLRAEKTENEETVRNGRFEGWPVLRDEELGFCLVKAWRGEYESAGEALCDVRALLESCGRVLVDGKEDEIGGFDWEAEFEYEPTTLQISRLLNKVFLA